jgi:hypothetical protein
MVVCESIEGFQNHIPEMAPSVRFIRTRGLKFENWLA